MSIKHLWFLAAVSILVSGCGGGGSGETPGSVATPTSVVPTVAGPTVPLEAAISALFSTTRTYTRTETGLNNGDVYDFEASYVMGAPTSFEGTQVRTVSVTHSIKKNGAQFSTSSQNDYFLASPYRLIGTTLQNSSVYVVASGQIPLPATAKPGDSGKFYDTITYDSASKKTVLATSSLSWAVTADTATTVTFCVNSVNVVSQIPGSTNRSDCYKVDTAGTVPMVGFTLPTSS